MGCEEPQYNELASLNEREDLQNRAPLPEEPEDALAASRLEAPLRSPHRERAFAVGNAGFVSGGDDGPRQHSSAAPPGYGRVDLNGP